MPGFIHRLFGRDQGHVVELQQGNCSLSNINICFFYQINITWTLSSGPTVWSKGSCDAWYFKSKVKKTKQNNSLDQNNFLCQSDGLNWRKKWRKWWVRSLPAHIGLELVSYLVLYYIIHGIYW